MTTQFYDAASDLIDQAGSSDPIVHLRIQKRNARSFVTLIEGIDVDIVAKLLKALKKQLCCNGAIIKSQDHGSVVQLQGDHRDCV
jgi:translation initiation factor 1